VHLMLCHLDDNKRSLSSNVNRYWREHVLWSLEKQCNRLDAVSSDISMRYSRVGSTSCLVLLLSQNLFTRKYALLLQKVLRALLYVRPSFSLSHFPSSSSSLPSLSSFNRTLQASPTTNDRQKATQWAKNRNKSDAID
jgi:hypothetical protein